MKQLIYTISFIVAVLITSCTTKEGAPGPAGATGATGPAGTTGATGDSDMEQQGTINGTLSYVDVKGKNVSFSFDYQYLTSNYDENKFYDYADDGYYSIQLNRSALKDSENNNFYVSFSGDYDETGKPLAPTDLYVIYNYSGQYSDTLFVFQTNVGEGEGIHLYEEPEGEASVFSITNFVFDIKTGLLSFDYDIAIQNTDIANEFRNFSTSDGATLKGAVSAKLLNVPVSSQPE